MEQFKEKTRQNNHKLFLVLLMILSLLVSSCASTTLTSVWNDENFQGGAIKKVFVIGISQKPAIRRLFEDEFKKQFETRGIDSVSSYTVIPEDKMLDKDYVQSKVKDVKIDAVLITRLIDKKTIETYYPPETTYTRPLRTYPHPGYYPPSFYHDWYGYYYDCYQCITTPGYKVQDEIVSLETNLYDASNNKLIWSALSDTFVGTFEGGIDKNLIESFIQVIMKRLSQDRVL